MEGEVSPKFDDRHVQDDLTPLSEEHRRQRCRFLKVPYEPETEATRVQRGITRWKRWNHKAMAEGLTYEEACQEWNRRHPPAGGDPLSESPEDSSPPRPGDQLPSVGRTKERGPDPSPCDLIYGNRPDTNLVFMERSKALENFAFWAAVTWGDFRKSAPALYEWALGYEDEDTAPADDDELDHEPLSADGDFPYFPDQLMLDFIPEFVQQRFGRIEWTVHNGEVLELKAVHEREIVAALLSQGFSCERDQALVDAQYLVS